MTIQELKDTIYVYTSPDSAAPSVHMTDPQWQQKFRLMKQMVRPSRQRRMSGGHTSEAACRGGIRSGTYDGATNWQTYAMYINDTLSQLRSGETAYAWFTYQIRDLLSYEHDRLCSRYCPQDRMWILWLEGRSGNHKAKGGI